MCVFSGNLISQTLQGTNLHYSFSFSLRSSQTQKNGGNSVTLATNSAYVQREAADGGGRREKERKIGSEKANMSAYCTHTHTELSRWTVESGRSGFFPSFKPNSIQASSCTFPRSLLLFLLLHPLSSLFTPWSGSLAFFHSCSLATYEGCSNTTCFLWHPPGTLSNLSTVVFSLLPSSLLLSYLFTAGCLFSYWLFYRGYEWALSLPCSALYRSLLNMFSPTHTHLQTHTHTYANILSLSWLWVSVRCRDSCSQAQYVCDTCWNPTVTISELSFHRRRVENVCHSSSQLTNIMRQSKDGEKDWDRKNVGKEGERDAEFELKSSSSFHNGATVCWMWADRKKKVWKSVRGSMGLTECVWVSEWGGQSVTLLSTFLHTLTGCSAVAVCVCVCVCLIKEEKFEWMRHPNKGQGLYINYRLRSHTHIHTETWAMCLYFRKESILPLGKINNYSFNTAKNKSNK